MMSAAVRSPFSTSVRTASASSRTSMLNSASISSEQVSPSTNSCAGLPGVLVHDRHLDIERVALADAAERRAEDEDERERHREHHEQRRRSRTMILVSLRAMVNSRAHRQSRRLLPVRCRNTLSRLGSVTVTDVTCAPSDLERGNQPAENRSAAPREHLDASHRCDPPLSRPAMARTRLEHAVAHIGDLHRDDVHAAHDVTQLVERARRR